MRIFLSKRKKQRGYILLMSILISSIILAISFGVYALTIKEIILASFLKDSASALSAADRAIECTLYWDRSTPQDGMPFTIFASSSAYTAPWVIDPVAYPKSSVLCDDVAIANSWAPPTLTSSPDSGLTKFTITYPDNSCAEVSVFKEGNATTTIVSNGYNICGPANDNNPRRTQRTIQVIDGTTGTAVIGPSAVCPFAPLANRIIVNWQTDPGVFDGYIDGTDRKIKDNSIATEGHIYSPANIPPGTYKISAYIYDANPIRTSENEPSEQVVISFRDAVQNDIVTTSPTLDLPDNVASASWQGVVENAFVIPPGVALVNAYHYVVSSSGVQPPGANKNDLQPICAALDN